MPTARKLFAKRPVSRPKRRKAEIPIITTSQLRSFVDPHPMGQPVREQTVEIQRGTTIIIKIV